jgi:hypothetical protein
VGIFEFLRRLLDPPAFVVQFENGEARARKGALPAAFLHDCTDVASAFGILAGRIYGHQGPRGLRLEFSSGIPAESHQRFRNVFGLYRGRIKS